MEDISNDQQIKWREMPETSELQYIKYIECLNKSLIFKYFNETLKELQY